MALQAYGDRVIVKRKEKDPDEKVGLLYIPSNAQKKSMLAEVVSVGEGAVLSTMFFPGVTHHARPHVSPGDTVLLSEWAGQEYKDGDEVFLVISTSDILAMERK